MNLEDYDSEAEAKRNCEELLFRCENDHEVTVYSSDPYYPDWVECPNCGRLMEHDPSGRNAGATIPASALYDPTEFQWSCSRCDAEKTEADETLMDHYQEEHSDVLKPKYER